MRDDLSLRRLAIQIACQLPEDRKDAERVLDYAREQILEFMQGNDITKKSTITLLRPVPA